MIIAYIPKYQIIFCFFLITSVNCPSLFFLSVSVLVCLSVCVCMHGLWCTCEGQRKRTMCRSQVFPSPHWSQGFNSGCQFCARASYPQSHLAGSTVFCFPTASGTSLKAKASIHALSSPAYNVAAPYRLVEWMMNGWVMGFILSVIFPSFLN